jgi:putative tryptophan/tyrosine transport system substrate-binding protein
MRRMRRRDFITLLGGTAATWPLAAGAQQPDNNAAIPAIGYLGSPSPADAPIRFAAWHAGLKEAGFVEGKNVTIDYHAVADRYDRYREFAFYLIQRPVDVVFTSEKGASQAAKALTKKVPIVFAVGGDPVTMRLVASAARPGANVTGINFLLTNTMTKQLELVHQAVPSAAVVAVLVNPANADAASDKLELQYLANRLGLQLLVLSAANTRQLDEAMATLVDRKIGALVVEGDAFFSAQQDRLIALAADHRIAAIYSDPEIAGTGGLMTYGASVAEAFRLAGGYIGRILKGEKPADMPVQLSTKNELIINLSTAKALGLTLPKALLASADTVIG